MRLDLRLQITRSREAAYGSKWRLRESSTLSRISEALEAVARWLVRELDVT